MEKDRQQCVIFCALPAAASDKRYIRQGAYCIAADAGYLQAMEWGIVPDLVVGDFDSSPRPAPDEKTELIALPPEKDDTDTHYAVREALDRGFRDILLLGGVGGRADHTFANLSTLLFIARQGGRGRMVSQEGEWVCMGPGVLRLERSHSWVSVFPAGGTAKGVTLKGLKYPLDQAVLTPDFPVGTSNEFAGAQAEVSCSEGYLYVLVTPMEEP